MKIRLSAFSLCLSLALRTMSAQMPQRTILHQVEPEYESTQTGWLLDPASVQMVVDAEGLPFSLASVTPLPDNVVQALAQWRFAPGKPATFSINLQIRRALDRYLGRTQRPSSLHQTHPNTAVAASKLTADRVSSMEPKLKDTLDGLDQRTELIKWAASARSADANRLRSRHIEWFVRNRPGDAILDSPYALISPDFGPLADPDGFGLVKKAWLDRLTSAPGDSRTLGHATWFFQFTEPQTAEDLLMPAISTTGGAAAWLGELYAYAALGVKSLNPSTSAPIPGIRSEDHGPAENAFEKHARSSLDTIKDVRILLSALATLTTAGRSLRESDSLPAGFPEMCNGLLSRIKPLYPAVPYACELPGKTPAAGNVEQARIVRQTRPTYPPTAKSRFISGSVHFSAMIGKDGKIHDLELLSAPLVFYAESRATVLHWEYKPTALNGEPVEVLTQIDVNYTMQ